MFPPLAPSQIAAVNFKRPSRRRQELGCGGPSPPPPKRATGPKSRCFPRATSPLRGRLHRRQVPTPRAIEHFPLVAKDRHDEVVDDAAAAPPPRTQAPLVTESRLLVRADRALVGRRHVQPDSMEAQLAEPEVEERVHTVRSEAAACVLGQEKDCDIGADSEVDLVKAALADQVGGAELADGEEELAFTVALRDLLVEPLLGHLAADRPTEADQIGDLPVVEGDERLVEIV